MTRYRTIVADPPWDAHAGATGFNYGRNDHRNRVGRWAGDIDPAAKTIAYKTMSVDQIAALPVGALADPCGAHLYLWVTAATLRDAFTVCDAWGFSYVCPLVWCKAPMGFMGGAFLSNVEFVLHARCGDVRTIGKARSRWFQWKRPYRADGKPDHSTKPEAFLDLVESVSPGPYLELFARRQRLGWDTWGDEALEHVSLTPEDERVVRGGGAA